eukprot:353082-Chlamydomonas_euryale.AAC.14
MAQTGPTGHGGEAKLPKCHGSVFPRLAARSTHLERGTDTGGLANHLRRRGPAGARDERLPVTAGRPRRRSRGWRVVVTTLTMTRSASRTGPRDASAHAQCDILPIHIALVRRGRPAADVCGFRGSRTASAFAGTP